MRKLKIYTLLLTAAIFNYTVPRLHITDNTEETDQSYRKDDRIRYIQCDSGCKG